LAFSYLGDAQEKRLGKLTESMEGALFVPCDVTKDEEIEAFFAKIKEAWGHIDFLIHSVAYADRNDLMGRYVDTSRANFQMTLDISAYSLVALARAAEPLFPEQGGSIVAMTFYGAEKVVPHYNVMGVAKATLEASARYLAADLGPKGIRVNCISAGPVKTLAASAIQSFRRMLAITEQNAPLQRNITLDDVAGASLYLLSDLSTAVTGEVLHVDSGYNILGMFELPDLG
jgi:enoyl-[acyl-carrier protein] reductase I